MAKKLRRRIMNTVANILSAPARFKSKRIIKRANKDIAIIKRARKFKGVPHFDYKGRPNEEAIQATTAVISVRRRRKRKK